MRILHIDTGLEMRGGQWQALLLMRGLRKAGHSCLLLAPSGSALLAKARDEGMDAEALRFGTLLARADRFDVTHAHSGRAHTYAAVTGVRPLVVARRVAFAVRRGVASRWKYSRADRYIAVSDFVRQKLLDAGIPADRIVVVYDGVPLLDPSAGGGPIAPASDDPQKGTALAREAATLAGIDLRFSSDLQADLKRADFLVYLTESEGLGSGALLAMAAGVPVVASNVGGLREVVADGETGFLVENDAREIARAIERLAGDRELCQTLGRAARTRVEREFTLEKMVEATIEVYREVAT